MRRPSRALVPALLGMLVAATAFSPGPTLAAGPAPTVTMAFTPDTIAPGATSVLSISIFNTEPAPAATGIGFTDTLPAGLTFTASPVSSFTCDGTLVVNFVTQTMTLSGATLVETGGCTVAVKVVASAGDVYVNSTTVSSSNGSATGSATLTVVAPPTLAKVFGSMTVGVNETTSLTFAVTNPNATTPLTGIAFTDPLPAGLVLDNPNGLTGSCGGGTIVADPGSSAVSLTGATLAGGASCTFSVSVLAISPGVLVNITDAVTATESGPGAPAIAAVFAIWNPAFTASFAPASIPVGGSSMLTFSVTNPEVSDYDLSNVSFTATLPAGVTATNGLTMGACPDGSGILTVTGGNTIALTGATVPVGWGCPISLPVTGTVAGVHTVTSAPLAATLSRPGFVLDGLGIGAAPATATITVVAPPTLAKAFGGPTVAVNGSTSLVFTITNPNATAPLTGIAFTDVLPAGLVVSAPNNVGGSCGGTITAAAGSGTVSLSGLSLAPGASCGFGVDVTAISPGLQINTTGPITAAESGDGGTATAVVRAVWGPTLGKAFVPASIPVGSTATLTFTIGDPEVSDFEFRNVSFTDTLPAGMTAANGTTTGLCDDGTGTMTGTLTVSGGNTISVTGATVPIGWTCSISLTVHAPGAGVYSNVTGAVSADFGEGDSVTGNTATATLTVVAPPSIAKAFGAASIPLHGTTSLTFTVANPNASAALTGVAFSDMLPAGLVVASVPGVTSTCGGTVTATAGGSSVSLAGGTIPADGTCHVTVAVEGTSAGVKTNTTGVVTSTDGGSGNTATATLTVVAPPSIAKAFSAASIPLNTTTSLTFTITNPNTSAALTGVAFTDGLPAGLSVASGTSTVCGGTLTTTSPSGIALSGATIAAGGQCTFSVTVTGQNAGTLTNTTGAVASTNGGSGNTATATLTVVAPPSIVKAFGAASITLNTTTSLTFTITNPNASAALTGVAFSDALPVGLSVAAGTSTVCGGTLTTTSPTGIALSGATIAASGQCVFSVTVKGVTAGTFTNTTGAVASGNGGTGNTATATLSVLVLTPPNTTTHLAGTALPASAPPVGILPLLGFAGLIALFGFLGLLARQRRVRG